MQGSVVAVTGSVGKTGTKEMLRLAFSALGPTHAPVGSFNNHWGVPLTLARMPADTHYGVFEIGMNHAGEIRPLTKLVRPHAAIVTNCRAGASRVLRQRGGDRRSQGRDFRGPGAGRDRDPQSRQSLVRAALPSGRGSTARASSPSARTLPPISAWIARRSTKTARACRRDSPARPSPIGSAPRAVISCRTRSPCSPRRTRARRRPGAGDAGARRVFARRRAVASGLRSATLPERFTLIDESYNANPDLHARCAGAA